MSRADRERRLARLEAWKPPTPTSGDLWLWAELDAFLERYGAQLSEPLRRAVQGEAVGAAAIVDFIEAVESIDPDAGVRFWQELNRRATADGA